MLKFLQRQPLLLIAWAVAAATSVHAGKPLPRAAPEEEAVSAAGLYDFVDTLDRTIPGMHGVVAVVHGKVVAEGWWAPYAAERRHVLYSLSKSFTSTAAGLAIADHKFSLDDPVLKFFPNDAPTNPSPNLKAMRVRDLLMMSAGHQDEPPTSPGEVSAKSFLAWPVPHLPGTHFKYNTAATFMVSAIVQKTTRQTVFDYLTPRLFEPLGIDNAVWDTNFQGINLGGYGLRVRTEDIAKFGLVYLHHGGWEGKKLVPPDWVAKATARQTSNGSNPDSDWNQGYGFQFWRCRHNAFRGDGAFGQFCVVMPDQDAVVAINSGTKDLQAVLNVIWDKFLPALRDGQLPADPASDNRLRERLAGLKIAPADGAADSPTAAQVQGRKYVVAENDRKLTALSLAHHGEEITLTIDGKDCPLRAGNGKWLDGRMPFYPGKLPLFRDEPVATSYGWTAPDTCRIKICAVETPFIDTLTLKFSGDEVTIDDEALAGFGPGKRPQLTGRAAASN